jgi:hypothetical protein
MEDVRVGDVILITDAAKGAVAKRIERVALEAGGSVTYDLVLTNAAAHYFAGGVMIQQKPIQ